MQLASEPVAAPRTRRRKTAWAPLGIRAVAILYLTAMLLVPLAAVAQDGLSQGLGALWVNLTAVQAVAALKLTLWTSGIMAVINAIMGTLTAYVLVRYQFPGRSLVNAIIDLPLAVPTLVTGVMLVLVYGPAATLGRWFTTSLGFQIIYAQPGIVLALLFVTFPFVVRAIQPVLMAIESDQEDAAHTLGASSFTTLRKVLLPMVMPAIITGTLLSFSRAMGEFGSIVLVSGNIPMRTVVASVFVQGQIESYDRQAASAMSLVMVAISFGLVLFTDWLQRRAEARRLPRAIWSAGPPRRAMPNGRTARWAPQSAASSACARCSSVSCLPTWPCWCCCHWRRWCRTPSAGALATCSTHSPTPTRSTPSF